MASIRLNPVLDRVRGKVGDLVFKKRGDSKYLARKPDFSNLQPSAAQREVREKFSRAVAYAKLVSADPTAKAPYEAAAASRKKTAFNLMVGDYFNAPQVQDVDLALYSGQPGDTITVRAADDFEVTGVTVTITDAGNVVLESGAAVKSESYPGRWVYTATTAVQDVATATITATATDRPGNTGSLAAAKQ